MFSVPLFTALFCGALCLIHYLSTPSRGKHILLIIRALGTIVICWLGCLLFASGHESLFGYLPVFSLILMLDRVSVYHFVFAVTATRRREKFRIAHYAMPLIITIISVVGPAEAVYGTALPIAGINGTAHPFHSIFAGLFAAYTLLYIWIGFRRIGRYRRAAERSQANTGSVSLRWLYVFIWLIPLSLPIPFAAIFLDGAVISALPLVVIGALLPAAQYLIVAYNVLSDNHVFIEHPEYPHDTHAAKPQPIDRKRFEAYIGSRKPYLDPKLRIADIAAGLNTNRSYVSAFINREYGVNFNRYINRHRLEELDRLRTSPENGRFSNMELSLMAGFSSYRSYLRVRSDAG